MVLVYCMHLLVIVSVVVLQCIQMAKVLPTDTAVISVGSTCMTFNMQTELLCSLTTMNSYTE